MNFIDGGVGGYLSILWFFKGWVGSILINGMQLRLLWLMTKLHDLAFLLVNLSLELFILSLLLLILFINLFECVRNSLSKVQIYSELLGQEVIELVEVLWVFEEVLLADFNGLHELLAFKRYHLFVVIHSLVGIVAAEWYDLLVAFVLENDMLLLEQSLAVQVDATFMLIAYAFIVVVEGLIHDLEFVGKQCDELSVLTELLVESWHIRVGFEDGLKLFIQLQELCLRVWQTCEIPLSGGLIESLHGLLVDLGTLIPGLVVLREEPGCHVVEFDHAFSHDVSLLDVLQVEDAFSDCLLGGAYVGKELLEERHIKLGSVYHYS
jgi:hypothetical protein